MERSSRRRKCPWRSGTNRHRTSGAVRADGYTLIVSPPAQLVYRAALYKSLTYDPAQLVPVALLAQVPYGLTVRRHPALATIKDFIAFARSNPGKLTYASQGVGSTSHLTTKLFEKLAGIQMLHIPYRGSAPALTDIVAGNIDAMFDNVGDSLPLFLDSRLQIIAIATTSAYVRCPMSRPCRPHPFRVSDR